MNTITCAKCSGELERHETRTGWGWVRIDKRTAGGSLFLCNHGDVFALHVPSSRAS